MKLDMKLLKTSVVALALLVGLSPAGFAQQSQPNQPDYSVVAAEMSSAIVWSETQTAQPVSADKATPTPDQQQQAPDSPSATPTQTSGAQAQSDSATQTFTGTIVRIGDKYVLKTTDNMTYQLDDSDKAKEFEGKQVKVTGGLDTKAKLIHIQNVELVP
jgi:lipoprotein-anchoring transpeptidase ErfK/SrfK